MTECHSCQSLITISNQCHRLLVNNLLQHCKAEFHVFIMMCLKGIDNVHAFVSWLTT